ncbi:phosphoglucomutase-2 [Acrodontium crateriforme]|uniref:Phosphoglucomutase-2 n=1 Tax=Acrodontium crateriforme TaxID=150365 RepID=A0AAQ3R714_9PEZI|nr:phosphoglucomutase-2 [Acrodontium crateriforme]
MATLIPIREIANQWIKQDQDEVTRKEIQDLVQANDEDELEKRLRKRIAFGTAGLRASMKAGFAHMNSLTVLQASQGLAQYINDVQGPGLSVVIGYDARHNSAKFARLAAGAFLAKGIKVLWFGKLVHTPMVPFSVNKYGAAAGVMVTASHNPKNDNGYKVYWSNGCQIIPPHDVGIAKSIENSQEIICWDETAVSESSNVQSIFDEATSAYFDALRKLTKPGATSETLAPFNYTAMHGVGLPFMQEAAKILGLGSDIMHVVEAQAQPDPEFPTVPFPNPEEKGALNLSFEDANKTGSSIVIANDPDADRFTFAQKLEDGRWHQFTGNQIGILLASYVFESHAGEKQNLAMLASTVSSRMLSSMAKKEGFHFQETLTGFKWLGNVAQGLRKSSLEPVFAYEEAIGYMLPGVVWDKDGVAAAVTFLTAWREWIAAGLTPWRKMHQLYEKYGFFEDANTYLISPSPETTERVFTDIRKSNNGSRPVTIGKRKILRWRDLTVGYDSAGLDGEPDLPVDPSAQMITCELEDVVFTARGSGTEPKIKLYIEGQAATSAEAKSQAEEVLQDLLQEWFKSDYSLKLAGT